MRRLAVVVVALAQVAHASTPEVFGLGSEDAALAGAVTARSHGMAALHYNPAGLADSRAPEASFGIVGFGARLEIHTVDGMRTQGISDPLAIQLGGAAPLPLGGVLAERIFVGIALNLVPGQLLRVVARAPETPFYPLYDNRTQRLVVLPGLAIRLPRVSIGVAINYLAGLDGTIQATEGRYRAIDARADEQIRATAAVNAGVRVDVVRGVRVGLTYRQEFGIPFRTATVNRVAGEPLDLSVDAQALYSPHQLIAGATLAWRKVMLSLDVGWAHWSGWRGPFLRIGSTLPFVGDIDASTAVSFNDTAIVRGGISYTAMEKRFSSLELRAGYGFESAAVPGAQALTNMLDGHKHRLAGGGGVRFAILGTHIRLDCHAQFEIVQPSVEYKDAAPPGTTVTNPGWPVLKSGGFTWAVGGTGTLELQ